MWYRAFMNKLNKLFVFKVNLGKSAEPEWTQPQISVEAITPITDATFKEWIENSKKNLNKSSQGQKPDAPAIS